MIYSGLVSVTFRQLAVDKIIDLVKQADLTAIEWGGDVHVPHGDIQCALDTRRKTEDAGLKVAAYGSYYRVGLNEPVPYEKVLESAVALGAPLVRVWAGRKNAEDADDDYWQKVVEDSQNIADLSADAGLKIAYEYHGNTLTNSLHSTIELLNAVGHQAVTSYWQLLGSRSIKDNLHAIDLLKPWLSNLHVNTSGRQALKNHVEWETYLKQVSRIGRDHYALIEFVKDDSPARFLEDAVTLKSWLQELQ